MKEEIYSILSIYNNNHNYVDEDFVDDVFSIVRKNYNLRDYAKYYSVLDMNDLANYNKSFRLILINLKKERLSEIKKEYPEVHYLFYNARVILDIIHEFIHADNYRIMNENINDNELLYQLLNLANPRIYNNDLLAPIKQKIVNNYYLKNWVKDPDERRANIISGIETMNVLDLIPDDVYGKEQLLKRMLYTINNNCMKGYRLIGDKTNSPSIEYVSNIPFSKNKNYIKTNYMQKLLNEDLSLYNRLLYGLSLSKEEYINYLNAEDEFTDGLVKSLDKLKK